MPDGGLLERSQAFDFLRRFEEDLELTTGGYSEVEPIYDLEYTK